MLPLIYLIFKSDLEFDDRSSAKYVDEAVRSTFREDMTEEEKLIRMNRSLVDALNEEKTVRKRLEEAINSHGVC